MAFQGRDYFATEAVGQWRVEKAAVARLGAAPYPLLRCPPRSLRRAR